MTTTEELERNLREAAADLESARRKFNAAAVTLASRICPYKIGDLCEIKGHSYNGKTGVVKDVTVSPTGYSRHYTWAIECVVLKDNGNESAHRTRFTEHDAQRDCETGVASDAGA